MNKAIFLAMGAAAMIGCGGDDDKKTDGGASGDMTAPTGGDMAKGDGGNTQSDEYDCTSSSVTCAAVTGFSVDIDLLSGYYAGHQDATAQELIQNSCVAATPVSARYDGTTDKFTETVMTGTSDSLCGFSLKAVVGKTIHLIAKENAATHVLNTFSQDPTVVASSGAVMQPAHVCTSNKYSAPVGVAQTLSVDVTDVESHGICMYGTNDVFTPPFVKLTPSTTATTSSGFVIYSLTDPTTMPPTFPQQASSPVGVHGLYNASNTAETDISITSTANSGSNTYSTFSCTVIPGYITFAPENPDPST